jgi:hypothetical protein
LIGELNGDYHTSDPGAALPFVAHSNGGLVSRRFSIDDGRLRKLVTVATPHQGSWLANNWLNYNVLNYAHAFGDALLTPIDYYTNHDPAVPNWVGVAVDYFYILWEYINYQLDAMMCPLAGMCVVWDGANYVAVPLTYDLEIGSPTLNNLNSPANLNREASVIQNRVGLYTSITPGNGFFHFAFPGSQNDWANAREATIATYIVLFDHYGDSYDFDLWYNRWQWLGGAFALVDFDAHWYDLIGALNYYQRTYDQYGNYWTTLSVYANDGLIVHTSAGYPGGIPQLVAGNISHTQQTSSPTISNALRDVLNVAFGIPLRGDPPPPPPQWSVVIHGPTTAQPGNTCYWYVSTNVADASYEWTVDGNVVGSAQDLWYTAYSSFSLRVQVWNGQGHGGEATVSVNISSENGQCYVE